MDFEKEKLTRKDRDERKKRNLAISSFALLIMLVFHCVARVECLSQPYFSSAGGPYALPADTTTLQGPASTYPVKITVFGLSAADTINYVEFGILGLTHDRLSDVDFGILCPDGGNFVTVLSDWQSVGTVNNADITFNSTSGTAWTQTGTLTSGTYREANFLCPDGFTGTPSSYSCSVIGLLTDFTRSDPGAYNGDWSLYAYDHGNEMFYFEPWC